MGVTVLYPYNLPEGMTGPLAMENFNKRLMALGAVNTGQFLVDCETYLTVPQQGHSKMVHVIHNTEYPVTTFSLLDTGTGKIIPLISDNIFDLVIIKITAPSSNKKQTRIESKGTRYEYGDFVIKVGSITMMENFKGILFEFEYKACVVISLCWELLREMMEIILGTAVPKEYPSYFNPQTVVNAMGQQHVLAKQNDIYEVMDTINQYLEHFTSFRKHNVAHPSTTQGAPNTPVGGDGSSMSSGVCSRTPSVSSVAD